MGEIKVRGKALMSVEELDEMHFTHDNGWFVGNLIQNGDNPWIVGDIVESDPEYIVHDFWVRVDPETVGQYTGLTDKHGKEIYEGDFLKGGSLLCTGGVRIDNICGATVRFESGMFKCGSISLVSVAIHAEVVGNIYDSPELLRGDDD